MIGIESRVDVLEADQIVDQESGCDQQRQRQRKFDDDQPIAETTRLSACAGRARLQLHGDAATSAAQQWNQR
jgi:hypothetical protein